MNAPAVFTLIQLFLTQQCWDVLLSRVLKSIKYFTGVHSRNYPVYSDSMDSSYLPLLPQTKCWPLKTAGLKSGTVVGYLPQIALFKTHEICSQNAYSLWALCHCSARESGNVRVVIKSHVYVTFSYFFCFAVEQRVGAWPPSQPIRKLL